MREPVFREPENLVEVVNQSRTYLISLMALMAVEYLMKVHPDVSFIVNGDNISSAGIMRMGIGFILFNFTLIKRVIIYVHIELRINDDERFYSTKEVLCKCWRKGRPCIIYRTYSSNLYVYSRGHPC